MKLTSSLILLAMAMLISACGEKITIETEYSKATNFNDFKYYSWHQKPFEVDAKDTAKSKENGEQSKQPKPPTEIDKLLDQNIRFMIDEQLAKAGMIKKESGQVDFLVHYTIGATNEVNVEQQKVYDTYATNYQTYGGGYGYAGRYYSGVGVGMTVQSSTREEMMVDRYKEGVMSLDFHEPDSKKLIWSATGEKRLAYETLEPAERDKLIEKVIGKLLAKFPPK